MALSDSAGDAETSAVRPESESPAPEDKAVEQIDSLATSLSEQMRQLKARYREERRKLETRSFDPSEND